MITSSERDEFDVLASEYRTGDLVCEEPIAGQPVGVVLKTQGEELLSTTLILIFWPSGGACWKKVRDIERLEDGPTIHSPESWRVRRGAVRRFEQGEISVPPTPVHSETIDGNSATIISGEITAGQIEVESESTRSWTGMWNTENQELRRFNERSTKPAVEQIGVNSAGEGAGDDDKEDASEESLGEALKRIAGNASEKTIRGMFSSDDRAG
jgi:hypothetical protein